MLDTHAATDHSDVCLSYLFTALKFKEALGKYLSHDQGVTLMMYLSQGWHSSGVSVRIMQ